MPAGLRFGEEGREAADVDRRVLGQHTDELYDILWLAPGGGFGNTTAGRLNALSPIETFPDALARSYSWNFRVRDNWRNHHLRVTVEFGSTGASTNTYNITVAAYAFGATIDPTAGRTIGSVASTPAGPAATTTMLSFSSSLTTSPVTSQTDTFLAVKVSRDGAADANNNDFALLGVIVEAYPA